MLSALKRIPNCSVSVLAAGIDDFVIYDNDKYLEDLSHEIGRVLHSDGCFLDSGVNSRTFDDYLKKRCIKISSAL